MTQRRKNNDGVIDSDIRAHTACTINLFTKRRSPELHPSSQNRTMPPASKRRKGKQASKRTEPDPPTPPPTASTTDLILTSEKRRGVYECDYCHSDISQVPRIRCAVCADFDLCLDCFVGTASTTTTTASSSQHQQHQDTHGYRVCYSTRYPLFPSSRRPFSASSSRAVSSVGEQQEATPTAPSEEEEDVAENKNAEEVAEKKPDEEETKKPGEVENQETTRTTEATTQDDATVNVEKDSPKESSDPAEVSPDAPQQEGTNTTISTTITKEETKDEDSGSDAFVVQTEDPKNVWTVEEDLRLLEGIKMHGLANWVEIAEVVGGQGSTGKTPKRCMERYLDDFLGRYGHILPAYTLVTEEEDEADNGSENNSNVVAADQDEEPRASKRRAVLLRSPSSFSNVSLASRKKFKAVPTESTPDYEKVWPEPYVPKIAGVRVGQDVGRDQAYKAEQSYVKAVASLESKDIVERVRKEWAENRLNKPGGPTVLPMHPDDVMTLPGAELAGFMPRRGDFDVEWENDAEQAVADMEFLPGESEEDKQLKLQVMAIYNSKLDEREKRKQFILSRKLYDYRKRQAQDEQLPRDERDLVQRMRLFERFHTPQEHEMFLADILKAKRLRKEIAKLQLYRRIGIRTLVEAEKYELDKARHNFHKSAYLQREAEAKRAEAASASGVSGGVRVPKRTGSMDDDDSSFSLWKKYRTSDRKERKSINRDQSTDTKDPAPQDPSTRRSDGEPDCQDMQDSTDNAAMDIDDDTDAKASGAAKTEGSSEDGDLAQHPGYTLLSQREVALCRKAGLLPAQYLEIKKVLVHQSLAAGLIDTDNSRRILVKIDVERRGDVIDFLVRAGWVSAAIGDAVRSLN